MKLPMEWLSDYLNIDGIEPKAYEHGMTMSGSKVEGIENPGAEIKNVVTGKILKIEQHPDADKLLVCQVDAGGETIQIVTGAKNVFEGAIVPVAKHKSTLPGGVKITKGKLRGVESFGMMCSTDELHLSETRADGILILPENTPIGEDITKTLGLDNPIVEFEITSNRPDCLSVIGLARESAATYGRDFKIPEISVKTNGKDVNSMASVEVKNPDLCLRYSARVVENVKIFPSPDWMQKRLKACGIRPINNMVDITNYVMLEYGQPMHAFDLNYVNGKKIVVRTANENEELKTLDDQPRKLDSSMLVIADTENPLAVAGVMGGANSEITESTTSILLESAVFDGISVRKTAKKLGMRTESSARFEKGLDPENTISAINRACQLIADIGAGEITEGIIDVRGEIKPAAKIPLDYARINGLLGCNIPDGEMVSILEKLGFTVENSVATPPSFRSDIECMADIAEEVIRIYSYDKIPSTLMCGQMVCGGLTKIQNLREKINNIMSSQGLYEILTYSFGHPKIPDLLLLEENDPKRDMIVIQNPLGEENSVMRTSMLGSMLNILKLNYNNRNPIAHMYEIGKIYLKRESETLPYEKNVLCAGMYGNVDFYDIKGICETLFEQLHINNVSYVPQTNNPTYHSGRCADIFVKNNKIGTLGQIHPRVARNFELDCDVYIMEIDVDMLSENSGEIIYKSLPKFPASGRDLAVIVDDNVTVAEIEKAFDVNKYGIIESFKLFDVYKGKQIEENKKSVAYSITFRAKDRTLTDSEINDVMENIINELKTNTGAILR